MFKYQNKTVSRMGVHFIIRYVLKMPKIRKFTFGLIFIILIIYIITILKRIFMSKTIYVGFSLKWDFSTYKEEEEAR